MRLFRHVPTAADGPVALTIGNFDGVHLGHREMLRRLVAAARGRGVPAAVLTFEPHPREFFAPDQAPARLTGLRDKLRLLAACGVDRTYLCRFDYRIAQMPPAAFIDRILVQGLAACWVQVGDDFRFGARRAGDFSTLASAGQRHGFSVEATESVRAEGVRVSSTAVREALAGGDLSLAARLLGAPWSVSGRVVGGDRIGRELGFPTANVHLEPGRRMPLAGIFAVTVHGAGPRPRPAVASLGVRPTVTDSGRLKLEVHLFDFSGDLYGASLQVDFLHKLRDEARYDGLPALVLQIEIDCVQARDFHARRAA
jgi:riboflavin kinase/FMN adenylyltransferase